MDTYEIIIKGQLDQRWGHRLENLRLVARDDGTTQLSGPLRDQAALHGVLARIRDLGLPLLLVRCYHAPATTASIERQGAQP